MKIGYTRESKADGSQDLDLQNDLLKKAGVKPKNIYQDKIFGRSDDRPGLESCLKVLRGGDTLIVWKLDRLGKNLSHLVSTVQDLSERGIGFKVLSGEGANIDTATPAGKLVSGVFTALAEFDKELIRERTIVGPEAARARGKKGGRKFVLTKVQVRKAQAAMKNRGTSVSELCKDLEVSRQTLYKYVGPKGELREFGAKVLNESK